MKNTHQLFLPLAFLLLGVLFLNSCKKDDDSFTPIVVEGVEDKLVGRWNVVSARSIGTIEVSGVKIQANGKNKGEPNGFYELSKDPNEYTYDLTTVLEMTALGGSITQSYDYNDKDAGTWEVADNEKSVLFSGNQGIDQRVYFTQYDSNSSQYMEIAIPIDTVLGSYQYEGTAFLNMVKED